MKQIQQQHCKRGYGSANASMHPLQRMQQRPASKALIGRPSRWILESIEEPGGHGFLALCAAIRLLTVYPLPCEEERHHDEPDGSVGWLWCPWPEQTSACLSRLRQGSPGLRPSPHHHHHTLANRSDNAWTARVQLITCCFFVAQCADCNIGHCQLGREGARALRHALVANTVVRALNLRDNGFDSRAIAEVISGLSSGTMANSSKESKNVSTPSGFACTVCRALLDALCLQDTASCWISDSNHW